MKVSLHKPTLVTIREIPRTDPRDTPFPVVQLTDYDGGCLDLFPGDDWGHWDAIVAAVAEYRRAKVGVTDH